MQTSDGLQIPDLAGMLRRRLSVAAAVAGAIFLLSIVLAAVLPGQYDAAATLMIEPQSVSKSLVEAGLEDSDLNNRLHLMQMQILSRGRLSRVIDELGLYPEESAEMTREDIIVMMRQQISVVPVLPEMEVDVRNLQINTFQIGFRSESPRIAAAVANRLAQDFIEQHIKERVQVSGDTSEFIDAELERIAGRTREVDGRIAVIKSENAGRLPEDFVSNQRRLERTIASVRDARRDVALAESDETFYRLQASSGIDGRNTSGQPDSPNERLQRLELLLAEYEARGFTEKHPDVLETREQVEIFRDHAAASVNDPEAGSPQQTLALGEADRARLRAASAHADLERMQEQVVRLEEQLSVTPRVAEQLSLLESERDHLRASFREFSAKRLEASVAADMERRQKGEQFRLLDSAISPPKPTTPNRPLIVILGLLLGLASGAALAFVIETLDPSFHESRSIQMQTGLPVLAAIPDIILQSDRERMHRHRLLAVLLAAGISTVSLLGAGVGYWFVNGPGAAPAAVETAETAETEG